MKLTTQEIADEWGVSRRWIEYLCKNGKINAEKFGFVWMIEPNQKNPRRNKK